MGNFGPKINILKFSKSGLQIFLKWYLMTGIKNGSK